MFTPFLKRLAAKLSFITFLASTLVTGAPAALAAQIDGFDLSVIDVSTHQVNLAWTPLESPSEEETVTYALLRAKNDPNGPFLMVSPPLFEDATFIDIGQVGGGFAPGDTLYYKVVANSLNSSDMSDLGESDVEQVVIPPVGSQLITNAVKIDTSTVKISTINVQTKGPDPKPLTYNFFMATQLPSGVEEMNLMASTTVSATQFDELITVPGGGTFAPGSYYFVVEAEDAEGSTVATSTTMIVTFLATEFPPLEPEPPVFLLNMEATGQGFVALTWPSSTVIPDFEQSTLKMYRLEDPQQQEVVTAAQIIAEGTELGDVPASDHLYLDYSVLQDTTYYYAAEAYNAAGEIIGVAFPAQGTTPQAPEDVPISFTLSPDTTGADFVTLKWIEPINNVAGSRLELFRMDGTAAITSEIFENGTAILQVPTTDFTVTDLTVLPETDYAYAAKIFDGDTAIAQSYIPVNVTTLAATGGGGSEPPATEDLIPFFTFVEKNVDGDALITWQEAPAVENNDTLTYKVYRLDNAQDQDVILATDVIENGTVVGTVGVGEAFSFVDSTVSAINYYSYAVLAYQNDTPVAISGLAGTLTYIGDVKNNGEYIPTATVVDADDNGRVELLELDFEQEVKLNLTTVGQFTVTTAEGGSYEVTGLSLSDDSRTVLLALSETADNRTELFTATYDDGGDDFFGMSVLNANGVTSFIKTFNVEAARLSSTAPEVTTIIGGGGGGGGGGAPILIPAETEIVELLSEKPVAIPCEDTEGHFSHDAFNELRLLGVIDGKEPGVCDPEGKITRAELVKVALLSNGYIVDETAEIDLGSLPYSDLEEGAWYLPYFAVAHSVGVLQGYGDGTARPNDPVSQPEALAFLVRAAGMEVQVDPESIELLSDDFGDAWYADLIRFGLSEGLIDEFDPRNVSRGEAVVMDLNVINRSNS